MFLATKTIAKNAKAGIPPQSSYNTTFIIYDQFCTSKLLNKVL